MYRSIEKLLEKVHCFDLQSFVKKYFRKLAPPIFIIWTLILLIQVSRGKLVNENYFITFYICLLAIILLELVLEFVMEKESQLNRLIYILAPILLALVVFLQSESAADFSKNIELQQFLSFNCLVSSDIGQNNGEQFKVEKTDTGEKLTTILRNQRFDVNNIHLDYIYKRYGPEAAGSILSDIYAMDAINAVLNGFEGEVKNAKLTNDPASLYDFFQTNNPNLLTDTFKINQDICKFKF